MPSALLIYPRLQLTFQRDKRLINLDESNLNPRVSDWLFRKFDYSLSQIFPVVPTSDEQRKKGLDELFSEVVSTGFSELHLWYRVIGSEAGYRFGSFADTVKISDHDAYSLAREIYQIVAGQAGNHADEITLSSLGESLSYTLPDGTAIRLYICIGLSYPHGFDLICRVLVK